MLNPNNRVRHFNAHGDEIDVVTHKIIQHRNGAIRDTFNLQDTLASLYDERALGPMPSFPNVIRGSRSER